MKKKFINIWGDLEEMDNNKSYNIGDQFLIGNPLFGYDSLYCCKVEESENQIIYYFND